MQEQKQQEELRAAEDKTQAARVLAEEQRQAQEKMQQMQQQQLAQMKQLQQMQLMQQVRQTKRIDNRSRHSVDLSNHVDRHLGIAGISRCRVPARSVATNWSTSSSGL